VAQSAISHGFDVLFSHADKYARHEDSLGLTAWSHELEIGWEYQEAVSLYP
jgi:hypothetical protein